MSSKNVDLINETWFSNMGTCVISPINARIWFGIMTSLLFIILKSFFNNMQAYTIKFILFAFAYPPSLICIDKNFFISLLLF